MNYPGQIKKTYKKNINYANRGMDLEHLIDITNEKYLENGIAVIYKKPTPIQVVKYDYSSKKITDAYYKSPSTLDYNGIYNGYYIEFDAKNTNKECFPLSNIADHQIKHIKNVLKQNGIVFLLIMINQKCFLLPGQKVLEFIDANERKSIPMEYININGYEVTYNYLKGIDYITAVDKLIKEKCDSEKK